jgi:hypothetical protein
VSRRAGRTGRHATVVAANGPSERNSSSGSTASRRRWFGPEASFATLVGAIDDATGTVKGATFRAQEDAAGYLTILGPTADHHGLPWLVWSDPNGILHRDARPFARLTLVCRQARTHTSSAKKVASAERHVLGRLDPERASR